MRIPDKFAGLLLEALRPREREVLGLHFLDQFEVGEIGHLLRLKPDSVSGHITKGLIAIAKIIDSRPDDARRLLENMGESFARSRPKERLILRDEHISVDVLPHRQVMGAAIRHDDHLYTDTLRYFIIGVNGNNVNVSEAEQWAGNAPSSLSSRVVRELLAMKGIKQRQKYDDERVMYFWPATLGCTELYYERDFDHRPIVLPLREGRSIMDHLPPTPAVPDKRKDLVPRTWPFRVVELGEYAKEYDDAMAEDAERALRSRKKP